MFQKVQKLFARPEYHSDKLIVKFLPDCDVESALGPFVTSYRISFLNISPDGRFGELQNACIVTVAPKLLAEVKPLLKALPNVEYVEDVPVRRLS